MICREQTPPEGARKPPAPPPTRPWYLWANLLSLDAPVVALAWQDLFARSLHVALGPAPRLVTAACVWLAYAGDRLLDGNLGSAGRLVTPRHQFARLHRAPLAAVWTLLLLLTAWGAFARLRPELVRGGLILSAMVVAYFVIVHWPGKATLPPGFKEVGVATLFSGGTITFVVAAAVPPPAQLAQAVVFWLLLCFLNLFLIGCWEKERDALQGQPSLILQAPALRRRLAPLAPGLAVVAFVAGLLAVPREIGALYFSVSASALLLGVLDFFSHAFDLDELRVAADLALLTPLIFLPFPWS